MTNSIQGEKDLTLDLFMSLNLNEILACASCGGIEEVRKIITREAKRSDFYNDIQVNALLLLEDVTSMRLIPFSRNDPFRPLVENSINGQRSASMADLCQEDLAVLAELLDYIKNMYLRVRIADLLWVCKNPRTRKHAIEAVDGYLALSEIPEAWSVRCGNLYLDRAYYLSKRVGYVERIDLVRGAYSTYLMTENDLSVKVRVAQTVLEHNVLPDESLDLAVELISIGNSLVLDRELRFAVLFFELSSQFYLKASDIDQSFLAKVKAAECHEQYGDECCQAGAPNSFLAKEYYEQAYHIYQEMPISKKDELLLRAKIDSLYHKIIAAGKKIVDAAGKICTPIGDSGEYDRIFREHVSGKSDPFEVLLYFVVLCPFNLEEFKCDVVRNLRGNLLSSLISSSQYASDGRTISKTPAVGLDAILDPSSPLDEKVLNDSMVRAYNHKMQEYVKVRILPALDQILLEHNFSRFLLFNLCLSSPLIPKQIVNTVTQAVWLGFEGDFASAIYIVAPMVERILRERLKCANGKTSVIDEEGINMETSAVLLSPKSEEILGGNLVFEYKAIFVDRSGVNLRNEVAHGLLNDDSALSWGPIYAWWYLLKVIVLSCSVVAEVGQ